MLPTFTENFLPNCLEVIKVLHFTVQSEDFWTYSSETGFSFSYAEVGHHNQPIGASDENNMVSKFDNSLSFGAKQKSLGQIFFAL